MGITISKEHGVNPSVELCFICGNSIGVILFGRLPGDREADRETTLGNICDECKENMKKVFFLIEAKEEKDGHIRTGFMVGIHKEHPLVESQSTDAKKNGFAFILESELRAFLGNRYESIKLASKKN